MPTCNGDDFSPITLGAPGSNPGRCSGRFDDARSMPRDSIISLEQSADCNPGRRSTSRFDDARSMLRDSIISMELSADFMMDILSADFVVDSSSEFTTDSIRSSS